MKNWYQKILNSGIDASFSNLVNDQIRALNKISVSVIVMLVISSIFTFAFIPEHRLFVSTIFFIEVLILVSVLALTNVQRIFMAKSVFTFNITFMVLLLVGYYGLVANFQYIGIISFICFLFLFRDGSKNDLRIVYVNIALFLAGVVIFDLLEMSVVDLDSIGLRKVRFLSFVSAIFVVFVTGFLLLQWHRANNESYSEELKELTEQSNFLRTISSNLDVAFFKSNPALGFEFVNESFAKIFGFESVESMMRTSPEKLYFNAEDRTELIDKLTRERSVHNTLIRYRKKSGELFYGRLSCNVIVERNQDRLVGVITDVTLQHHQDELLRQNELRLKEAQRIAKLGNFQLNEETMQMFWSEETFRLHGYPASELAPSVDQLIEHFPYLDANDFKTYFEACKLTGIPTEFGGWYIDPSGLKKYLQFRARYVELEKNESYWSGTVQDITEGKEMEEELEGTSRFYEAILNNAPLEIVLLDANLNYTFISEESIKNKDTRRWLIGKNDYDYCKYKHISPEIAEMRSKHFKESLETNAVVRWEEEMTDQYGRKNYIFRNVAPVKDPVDGTIYLAGFAINVTRLRESQISLEVKNQELVKLNQELDRFVYSISHDLRAPIASVLGLISLAEESESIHEAREILLMQREALDRLDVYIRDVIDYSRNKRLEPKAEQLYLSKIVENSLSHLAYLPGIDQIEFFYEYEGGDHVISDQMRVQIVVNNLISNAIKYVDSKKEHSYIRIATKRHGNSLQLLVQDNGIGVNPLYVEKIWEMFYRGTSESSGSGLGLYILKESLKNIAGEVSMETEFGKGTTFTVLIPDLG